MSREKTLVRTLVINAVPQGYVEAVVAATLCSNFIHVTCAREEVVSVFVERYCHDSVSEVEGFLNPVAMVDVNINVEHPRVVPGVKAKPASEAEVNPRRKSPQPTPPKHKARNYEESTLAQVT